MNGNSAALDTNQAIAILNDVPAAIAFYSTFDELILPATVIGELRFGALNSQRSTENLEKIDRLAARCRVLDTTATTAIAYAQIRMQLKQIGHPTPENDIWIAAVCVQHSIALASADRHFNAIQGLTLISPPVP